LELQMTTDDGFTDGNVLAGPLAEVFAVDITAAMTTCAGCGTQRRVAQLRVYFSGPGTIARCPSCDAAVLRYARTSNGMNVDFRGTLALSIPVSTETAQAQ
jgi:hypothetical protein